MQSTEVICARSLISHALIFSCGDHIMSGTMFNDVYDVCELGGIIMDELALPALLALSYTSKGQYLRVHAYIRLKLTLILAPFGISLTCLMDHLRLTDALVIGSVAFKAVAPAAAKIIPKQLDIVVCKNELFVLKDWLCIRCNYTLNPLSIHQQQRLPPVKSVVSLARHTHDQKKVVNLLVVDTIGDTYKTLFYATNTAYMNAITPWGLFTPYRSLLSQGKVAHNHILNTMALEKASLSLRARLQEASLFSEIAIRMQGFEVIPINPFPHLYYRCFCVDRTACPLIVRNTNDSHCSFIRVFSNLEFRALESGSFEIPIHNPRFPMVIWRLADIEGGSAGLAFLLREVPARLLVLDLM
jgi:hypothetical protein